VSELRRRLRRRALASSAPRRIVHALASAALRLLWRGRWVPGDDAANEPSGAAKRARVHWLDSLPDSSAAEPSGEPVDVMIPVGPNDVDVVPLAVAGVRAKLLDPVSRIAIVTPPELVENLSAELPGVEVVDETTILSADAVASVVAATPQHRTGWYLQQLVKLAWCLERSGPCTYVVDADTVLVRPQSLRTARGDVVFAAQEYHQPYFDHLARLYRGDFPRPLFGTTSHQMLYRRDWLRAMVEEIERANPGRTWIEAILAAIDRDVLSGFSEGECYGQWVVRRRRREIVVRPVRNATMSREGALASTDPVAALAATYGDDYDSVSLHYYVDHDPLPEWRAAGLER
jgi:hypothetical protein